MAAENRASDLEVQNLTTRLEQAQQDLDHCQDQLSTKSDELTAAQALPVESPKLLAIIKELETANLGLLGQIQTANGDVAKAKEELTLIKETGSSNTDHIRTLEGKLEHAQTRINGFEEEKKAIQAEAKEEIKRKEQEIAKKADFTKSNMQTKNDSIVKNLTQKCSELETELKSTKGSLQKAQDEGFSTTILVDKVIAEIASYKEKLGLQAVALERIEGQQLGLQDCGKQMDGDVISIGNGIRELQEYLATVRNATGQDLDAIFNSQAELETNFRKLDSLQQEKVEYQEKNNNLQKKLEAAEKDNREKSSLKETNNALEKELATLQKQLESATGSKMQDLKKENNALEKQISHLQAQVESLKQPYRSSKKANMPTIESTHQETPQQIQRRPTFQLTPSHPGYEDDQILKGKMPSPKRMLRDAMKQHTLASNPRMQANSRSEKPDSIPEIQFASLPTTHNPTSVQTSARPGSNVRQPPQSETTRATTVQSVLATKPSSEVGEELKLSRQASAREIIKRRQSSQPHDGEMLLTPTVISYSQYRVPAALNSGVDRDLPPSAGTSSSIKPLLAFTPIGYSPLIDHGPMIEDMESAMTQEQLNPRSKKRRYSQVDMPKKDGANPEVGVAAAEKVIPDSQSFGRGTPYKRNYIFPQSLQFSDVEEYHSPAAKRNKKLTAKEESNRRRASGPPPKSALKTPQQAPISNQDDMHTATATATAMASDSVLQDKSAGLGTNQKQTQQLRTRYNQGASGLSSRSKAGSHASNPAASSTRIPARNRTRSSETKEVFGKNRRVSLRNSALSQVIPDSQ